MSIKQNIKRRMLMVLALAMSVAVLAAGTAHAQGQPQPTSLTQTASSRDVMVGEPVTFHVTVTNDAPYELNNVIVTDDLHPYAQFVSASSSQGQCTYNPSSGENGWVTCDLGPLPPGCTAEIDIVVVPQEPGSINNEVKNPWLSSTLTVSVNRDEMSSLGAASNPVGVTG